MHGAGLGAQGALGGCPHHADEADQRLFDFEKLGDEDRQPRRREQRQGGVCRLRESVHGDILDSQNWLKRWFAENVVADADELPFHSGVRGTGQESLVVWYSTTRKGKRRFLLALFPKSESESRQAPQSQNLQIAGAAGRARPAVFQTTLT